MKTIYNVKTIKVTLKVSDNGHRKAKQLCLGGEGVEPPFIL